MWVDSTAPGSRRVESTGSATGSGGLAGKGCGPDGAGPGVSQPGSCTGASVGGGWAIVSATG
jgi:hypothetical protein